MQAYNTLMNYNRSFYITHNVLAGVTTYAYMWCNITELTCVRKILRIPICMRTRFIHTAYSILRYVNVGGL